MVDIYVGDAIRKARISRGLSQTQLATATGTSFQQLQKYERGDNRVSASRLFAICSVLQVEVASMFPPLPDKAEVIQLTPGRPHREIEHVYQALEPASRRVVMSVALALSQKAGSSEAA